MLNVKGRVVSVFDVGHQGDSLLLVSEPSLTDQTLAALEKHAIIDDVVFARESVPLYRVWTTPESVWVAPPRIGPCPEPIATATEVEVRRVEAGWPAYGVDVSEANFPFESDLDRFVDYKKGCYVGQEPVARVRWARP